MKFSWRRFRRTFRKIYARAWVSDSKFRGHLNLFGDSVANGVVVENNMKNELSAVENDFFFLIAERGKMILSLSKFIFCSQVYFLNNK